MAEKQERNYPDLLGYLTGGARANLSVIQMALAVQPRIIRAGRPFEVILLVQNASDVEIDVTATLKLPEKDTKGKKDRFIAKSEKLVIGLEAAEAGYLSLPVTTLPDTAVGQDYKIGLDIKVAPTGKEKPQRVRLQQGGGALDIKNLPAEAVEHIEKLKPLNFNTALNTGLRGSSFEVTFSVMSGKIGAIADLQPGWTSLWTLKDYTDDRLLLQNHRDLMRDSVLPGLTRENVFKPLRETTQKRFADAGFPLIEPELTLVTKLLTRILEYSTPQYGGGTQLTAGIYNVMPYLKKDSFENEINLPRWFSAFLRAVHKDVRSAQYPVQALLHFAYEDLVRDAMMHAFEMVEVATGEDIGGLDERRTYTDQAVEMLKEDRTIDFTHAYMPLIMGGILSFDAVMIEGEPLDELVAKIAHMMDAREDWLDNETEPLFKMAALIIDRTLMKYRHGTTKY